MEPVAYLIEGFDGSGKLYAKIVHFTVDEARNSAAEFARHYSTVTTTPLTRASGVAGTSDASAWWALVMGAAASIEDAANCLRDPDAKKQAEGAAKHYREAAQKLWAARGVKEDQRG